VAIQPAIHHASAPRIAKPQQPAECFRCGEGGEDVATYTAVIDDKPAGTIRLCRACASELTGA
jgi:hypothetical protein